MSRIRSIHPGIASDEAYMQMSMAAKAAWPILWTECDDHGVFEWKPIVLKARIFPADNIDFAALLSELEGLGCVRQFTVDGKHYGIVRNFCAYQRPKHPSYRHPFPPEQAEYAAFKSPAEDKAPEVLPPSSPRATEKLAQMKEEVGGGIEEERTKPSASSRTGSRWQKGQKVPDDWKTWAKTHFPSVEAYKLTTETRQFEDYWPAQSGKAGVKSDWEATYRVWMRKQFGAHEVDDTAVNPDLCVLGPDDADFKLVQAMRGKPIVLGKSGKTTLSKAEVERAREVSGVTH